MNSFTDQTGRSIPLLHCPKRIISVVPSQTELLYDLGLEKEVVGITKFCIHPQLWFREKQRVGGTKQLKLDLIRQLSPDLIIANKEENTREQIEELASEYPVWISDINDLSSALEMIEIVGKITCKATEAGELVQKIQDNFSLLDYSGQSLDAAYLIWKDPWMTIGGDTFINHIMEKAGLKNIFLNETRYPHIDIAQLKTCPLILLSSEPYPFKSKHIDELQQKLPNSKIMIVDGEMFSWYGSRLLKTPAYLKELRNEI